MKELNEEKIINEIKEGLDIIDSKIEVRIPSINHFRELVKTVDGKKKEKSRREFFAFLLVAVVILGSVTFAYYKYSVIFLVIQMLSVLFIPFGVITLNKRQGKQVAE